jgi:nucleoside-diphosphate-sugar epimerase
VSDGHDISTPRLIELIADGLGKRARMLRVSPRLLRSLGVALGRRAEIDRLLNSLQVDISPTCDSLGWRPPLRLEDAVKQTAKWYLEKKRAHS